MKKSILLVLLVCAPLFTVSQLSEVDEIASFNEGLAAVRKGNQWGFIDKEGALVIDFRSDLVWNAAAEIGAEGIKGIRHPSFQNGRCMVQKVIEDITVYGFIDTAGKLVVEHKFLNVSPFQDGYTIGIVYEKVFLGKNEIKLDVFKHKFHEVVMDSSGEILEYLRQPENIQMRKSRYELPAMRGRFISKGLIAIRGKDNQYELRTLDL